MNDNDILLMLLDTRHLYVIIISADSYLKFIIFITNFNFSYNHYTFY